MNPFAQLFIKWTLITNPARYNIYLFTLISKSLIHVFLSNPQTHERAYYCLQNEHSPNLTDGSNTLFEPFLCSGFIMNTEQGMRLQQSSLVR